MFKIGDAVMDKDGSYYMIIRVGFGSYEVIDADGNMHAGMLECFFAKYEQQMAEQLAIMATCITKMECLLTNTLSLLNEVKNHQTSIFELARRRG